MRRAIRSIFFSLFGPKKDQIKLKKDAATIPFAEVIDKLIKII